MTAHLAQHFVMFGPVRATPPNPKPTTNQHQNLMIPHIAYIHLPANPSIMYPKNVTYTHDYKNVINEQMNKQTNGHDF